MLEHGFRDRESVRSRIVLPFVLSAALLLPVAAAAQGLGYAETSDFLPQTPGVSAGVVGGFYNPAAWAVGEDEGAFWWNDRNVRDDELDNWGFGYGGNLGFVMDTRTFPDGSAEGLRIRTYQTGFSGGDRRGYVGLAWRWFGGDDEALALEDGPVVGFLLRPARHVSIGASGFFPDEGRGREGTLDLGVRPFGTPLLTLFGDYTMREKDTVDDGLWGAGVEVRPYRGIHIDFKAREGLGEEDVSYHVGLGLTFDAVNVHATSRRNEDFDNESMSYLVRVNPPFKGLPVAREVRRRWVHDTVIPISLERKVLTYQKDRWFDETRVAWLDLMRQLEDIRKEPGVNGIALNLSSFRGRPSLLWEFREKLQQLRAEGKHVYVYADRLDMMGMYLASAADDITLDPQGELMLPGLALHRTYMRGALEKLGLGSEEWRFLTHKTAFQTLTRKDMSEADKEQIGRIVDVIYETWREGISTGRGITPEAFDAVVNDDVLVVPDVAIERGLVDRTGRWEDLTERLRKEERLHLGGLPEDAERRTLPDERWGRPPTIVVVYTVGECAMDEGIKGRSTGKYLRGLVGDRDVAAVVLRADSPGGDPLPSDLVAEGTRKLKEDGKPVVVSQGDVAASGGYWISMDGSRILTTPLTITGSIGVIAGWVWDEGFSEKFGFTADGVQRGDHADLFTGIRVPLIGAVVPERNITEQEHEKVKKMILGMYDGFVKGVAEGRNLSEADVRKIAEGRVWMGGDAMERGLTDDWGGLEAAVAEAKALAGIPPDDEVILVEYPPRKLFSLPKLFPDIPGVRAFARMVAGDGAAAPAADPEGEPLEIRHLRMLAGAPGRPLLLVGPEDIPRGWSEEPAEN